MRLQQHYGRTRVNRAFGNGREHPRHEIGDGGGPYRRRLCAAGPAVSPCRDGPRQGRQGDRPERIHLILRGWAARYMFLPDGTRQIVAFLIPGDLADLNVAVLDHMDHGIVALSPCKVAYTAGMTTQRAALGTLLEKLRQVLAQ